MTARAAWAAELMRVYDASPAMSLDAATPTARVLELLESYDSERVPSLNREPDYMWAEDNSVVLVEAKSTQAGTAWRVRRILKCWSSGLRTDWDDAANGKELTPLLLRTAEETSVIPSVTSGLIWGLDPTPVPVDIWQSLGRAVTSAEKLVVAVSSYGAAVDVVRRVGRIARAGRPAPAAFSVDIIDEVEEVQEVLRNLAQGLLLGGVQKAELVFALPPHAASPCGLLRLAAPIVPGAPGAGAWPDQSTMTLAD
ncbi:hypothetical protein EV284_2798 [Streptomyces sp. BK022]|nr:hypothetical protein EV284_2798 [Streptomyces sp. BK022]